MYLHLAVADQFEQGHESRHYLHPGGAGREEGVEGQHFPPREGGAYSVLVVGGLAVAYGYYARRAGVYLFEDRLPGGE